MDPLFDMFITFCILVNTLFLSLEYHGMNENFRVALAVGNMVGIVELVQLFFTKQLFQEQRRKAKGL